MATHSNGETIDASHVNEKFDTANVDTDTSLTANSDSKVASQKAIKSYVDTKDGQNVKITGVQTVAGKKTFSTVPDTSGGNPSADNDLSRKAYVDTQVSAEASARASADNLKINTSVLDTDGTLAANSDSKIATQKATKTYVDFVAGDILLAEANTMRSQTTSTYTRKKEIQVNKGGVLRIKFDGCKNGGSGYARVYRNGVAVGTEQSMTTTNPTFTTYSEDISGWSPGDLVQLYAKGDNTYSCEVKNFKIYVAKVESAVVNTD